ncbi:hypothetical protein Ciccas_002591 [Cichlidogyrus casuarinus]|uniref:Tektin n=1 Tax=Cichlidogyrus casuarinus TaxID=1844966 RepID=A0ABD2QGT1_9PLAT
MDTEIEDLNANLARVVLDSTTLSIENKSEVDVLLQEHICETLEYRKASELELRQQIDLLENLRILRIALLNLLKSLNLTKHISLSCLHFREKRQGTELVHDEPEKCLFRELALCNQLIDNCHYVDWIEASERIINASWNVREDGRQFVDHVNKASQEARCIVKTQWLETNEHLNNNLKNMINLKEIAEKSLKKTLQSLHDLSDKCDQLDQNIKEKKRCVALIETRICLQNKRPEINSSLDPSNSTLRLQAEEEFAMIAKVEAENAGVKEAIVKLEEVKRQLQSALCSKIHAIHIEKHQCVQMREIWPDSPLCTARANV